MPNRTPDHELSALWLSQSTELMEMKLGAHRLRRKAEALRRKSRRESLTSLVLALLIAAGSVSASIWTQSPVARAAFAATAAWALIGQFVLHRTQRQLPPPEAAGLQTSLDSCRRELERLVRFDRGLQLWLAAPLILALGALLASLLAAAGAQPLLVKLAGPALALLVVFALSSAVLTYTHQRHLQNAIEELNRIEHER